MTPRDYANYLSRISYNLRNKLNPLYVMNVIAVQAILNDIKLIGHARRPEVSRLS